MVAYILDLALPHLQMHWFLDLMTTSNSFITWWSMLIPSHIQDFQTQLSFRGACSSPRFPSTRNPTSYSFFMIFMQHSPCNDLLLPAAVQRKLRTLRASISFLYSLLCSFPFLILRTENLSFLVQVTSFWFSRFLSICFALYFHLFPLPLSSLLLVIMQLSKVPTPKEYSSGDCVAPSP